jgi:hypothetical protein
LDKLLKALYKALRLERLDYLAMYPATVIRDHGDLHVDLEADDPSIGQLTRVPIWLGLPGVTAMTVANGSRVLLGFHQGHPDKHFADLWRGLRSITLEAGQTITFGATRVNLGAGASLGVARANDPITASIPGGVFMSPNPGGGPPIPNPPLTITGTIQSASTTVFAE